MKNHARDAMLSCMTNIEKIIEKNDETRTDWEKTDWKAEVFTETNKANKVKDLSVAEYCTCPGCMKNVSPDQDLCPECGYPIKTHYFKELYVGAENRKSKKEILVIKLRVLSQYLGLEVSDLPEEIGQMNEWAFNNINNLEKITEEDVKNLSDNPQDDYTLITEFLDYVKELKSMSKTKN